MRIRPVWAWYDLWIGFFWDRERRRLYWLPVPTLGFRLDWRDAEGEYWEEWADGCPDCTMMICGACGRPR